MQQVLMPPLLDDASMVHDHYAVRMLDGGQPVGDDQGNTLAGMLAKRGVQRKLHGTLAVRVQGACGLVQEQYGGVLQQRAGYGNALALAS